MPASENTWRDLKTLHVVFGFTGLLLLIATVALFAADHRREWKRYQRKMRDIDVRLTDWQIAAEQSKSGEATRKALEEQLAAAKASAPSEPAFARFVTELNRYSAEQSDGAEHPKSAQLKTLYDEAAAAPEESRADARQKLLDAMITVAQRARFEEDRFLSQRKFKAADYDEKRANYDLAIRDGLTDRLPAIQAEIDQEKAARDELSIAYEKAAAHRKELDAAIRDLNADIVEATKKLDDAEAGQVRLASALTEREATYFSSEFPFLGKKWLEFPVLDAFNSPLKIDTRWTKNLTMPNGGFGQVRRFDRCTTCHMAMEKTAPGSAIDPLYEDAHLVEFALATPETAPEPETSGEGEDATTTDPTLLSVYGIDVASSGLVDATSVTVRQVLPNSLAATAKLVSGSDTDGLKVGDVLRFVGNDEVLSRAKAEEFLLSNVKWGQPVRLRVERGLPQPFSSHPRLDLFVGSMSPHKVSVFGCTVCHEGQGSATEFKWVSHSPNDPLQEKEWVKKYGWFNNHHWIYPMQPARFSESTCLKCHHDVVELEASPKFAEAPAPKLMEGYHLIREYGCFGCHEINGYNSPTEKVGPDMRLEPNYYAAAAQLKVDPGFAKLGDVERGWVADLIQHPENTDTRHRLLEFLKNDKAAGSDATLATASHELITPLEDIETPGNLRKVGPSLRHISAKVGPEWLYDWIRDPTHFRPTTRMPKFFEQWKHLDASDPAELGLAQRFERIEILGLVTFLLKSSQPIELESADSVLPAELSEDQVASGKLLFETRGCLACHSHRDFPAGKATKGPELSNLGDKFRGSDVPNARAWLYTWLKNPSLYHARTTMPDLYLDPITKSDGTTVDPAADIAAYLLSSTLEWEPAAVSRDALTPDPTALNDLVKEHLRTKLYQADAYAAVDQGRVPDHLRASLTGSEAYLDGVMTEESKLMYIGHKTVSKYGCYACHDIPGFEGAKPIGTGLADWGRKDPSRLAFEHIAEYISHGHGHAGHGAANHEEQAAGTADEHAAEVEADATMTDKVVEKPFDESFYMQKLTEHDRTGFVWQKLKEPRSYDFKKTRNKDSYNDRLRMPAFPFTAEEREAVVTFVLGLVAEPPAPEFVYHADERQQAIIAGHKALTKFNCVGCHIVEPEKWSIEAPAGSFEAQVSDPNSTFPFMPHHFTTDQIASSSTPDPTRGTVHAELTGMPEISSDSGQQRILDEEGDEISEDTEYNPATLIYPFELWEPTLLEGNAYQVGVVPLEIPATWIKQRQETFGGDLTKWLLPRAVEIEKEANPQADGKQAYGWLPPPLVGEGLKVQTDWLHDFLLEPFMIRPAVFMRMPKFNMSSQEATDLANYFAAKDNASYPYASSPVTDTKRLSKEDAAYAEKLAAVAGDKPRGDTRFDHVMNIVTSSNYCVQCHIVGDFEPKTSERAKAPDLSAVNRRLRPDYLRRWIANPKQILPYTPMPVNVKYNAEDAEHLGGVEQSLYIGTSLEQLDGLVDLLMNYPQYTKGKASVADLVPPAAGATTTESSSVETPTANNVQ